MLPIRETFWLQKSISEAFSWPGVTYILLFSHKNMTMEVCCLLGRHFDYRRVFPKHFLAWCDLYLAVFPQEHGNGGMLPIRETFWLQKSISEAFSWPCMTFLLLFSHKNMTMEICCLLGRHFDYIRASPWLFPGLVSMKWYKVLPSDPSRNISATRSELRLNKAWWRHQMETFSALLAFYAENSPVAA